MQARSLSLPSRYAAVVFCVLFALLSLPCTDQVKVNDFYDASWKMAAAESFDPAGAGWG